MPFTPQENTERERKLQEAQSRGREHETERRAQELNLPYRDLTKFVRIDRDNLLLIPRDAAERAQAGLLKKEKNTIELGVVNPENQETKRLIEQLTAQGFTVNIVLLSPASLARIFAEYEKLPTAPANRVEPGSVSVQDIAAFAKEVTSLTTLKEALSTHEKSETSALLELLLAASLTTEASDIHIEPEEKNVRLRLRLDGVLEEVGTIEHATYKLLSSRLKLVGGIPLNLPSIAHDGRFTIHIDETAIEVRMSVVPGAYGEHFVLRILNPKTAGHQVDELGMRKDLWEALKKEITKPNGIVLVTGPTGSGKTTTLYAFLRYLQNPEIKIITFEDPIEYHLGGISQTQIDTKKGYTFAEGIRSALRQDPDVILIGEIRDEETAHTALHAALTGHFVFSTLHTNDAPGTIPRFLDLNAKPDILASTLNAAIAQRLVRTLCVECKKPAEDSSEQTKDIIKKVSVFKQLVPLIPKQPAVYTAQGCDACSDTGYQGRMGIFEALIVTPTIEKVISGSPAHHEVLEAATKEGFVNMYYDGLLRVLEGTTTIEEVERVSAAIT